MYLLVLLGLLKTLVKDGEANAFHNCNDSFPVLLHFEFPDIMKVELGTPLEVDAGATVREEFPPSFRVQHIMERRLFGKWFRLPCVGAQGNGTKCFIDMPCENFIKMGFKGTCPIQPGEYKQKIFIPVPTFHVPVFLTAGLYRTRIFGYSQDMKRMWFCGQLIQYMEEKKNSEDQTLLHKKLISQN